MKTPKVIDLKPSRPPWSHERGSLPVWKSKHYRNESLIVGSHKVTSSKLWRNHHRSWEQCGYRAAHLHHGWSICPLKSLRGNDLFNEALLALQLPESICTKIQIIHFSRSDLQSSGEIWWTMTNSVQISLGRSNHHISIKDSYCVGWWLALKELRDRTVLSSDGKISYQQNLYVWVVCRCFLPTKMEHHHQPPKNSPMQPQSWRKSRGSDGSLHTLRHSIRAYCSCAYKWGTQFFENFSESLFKTRDGCVFVAT